jgi:hypothetical protein
MQESGKLSYRVLDFSSRVVRSGSYNGQTGQNIITIPNMEQVPADMYILEVEVNGNRYFRKLVKI